jgi:hypothetical protein
MYTLNLQILSHFVIFCVDHNTKNFVMKICMPTGYIIDYIRIYFHIFLKLRNIIFIFKKNGGITGARESKTLSGEFMHKIEDSDIHEIY